MIELGGIVKGFSMNLICKINKQGWIFKNFSVNIEVEFYKYGINIYSRF